MLEGQELVQALEGCRILIANDYELDLIQAKTGLNQEGLLQRAQAIIATLGERGSRIITREGQVEVPAVSPRKVEDPTGAGNSYRGGLISGLVRGVKPRTKRPMGERLRFVRRGVLRDPGIYLQP